MDLNFEIKPEYLLVKISGTLSLVDIQDTFPEIIGTAELNQISKILIDGSECKSDFKVCDLFLLGEDIALFLSSGSNSKRARELRFAFVTRERSFLQDHFGDIVANNRGVDIWTFDNVSAAVQWLLSFSA